MSDTLGGRFDWWGFRAFRAAMASRTVSHHFLRSRARSRASHLYRLSQGSTPRINYKVVKSTRRPYRWAILKIVDGQQMLGDDWNP